MQRVSRGHEHDCLALQRIHNRVVEIDLVYDWYDFRQLRAAGRSIVSPVDYSLSVLSYFVRRFFFRVLNRRTRLSHIITTSGLPQ
jgi:hypothetical protein